MDSWTTPAWVANALEADSHSASTLADEGSPANGPTSCQGQCSTANTDSMATQTSAFSWTATILQHTNAGRPLRALRAYEEMKESGVKPISYTLVAALKACSVLQDLESAKKIQAEIVECGCELDVYVGTTLVDVYGKCGRLLDARCIFDKMPHRTVVSWNAMILGYAQTDKAETALELYLQMREEGAVVPTARTFVAALRACSTLACSKSKKKGVDGVQHESETQILEQVRALHQHIISSECEDDVYVGTMLVDVYVKCGSMVEARTVFDKMPVRNVVSWTAMVLGYAQMADGGGQQALQLYARMMRSEGVVPDERVFVAALKACGNLLTVDEIMPSDVQLVKQKCLEQVREIHADIVKHACGSDIYVGNALLDVYAKCGSLEEAKRVFQQMPRRDVVSWTAMLQGHAEMDEGETALELYTQMQLEGVVPDLLAFVAALKACSSLAALERGKQVHAELLEAGVEVTDLFVAASLIDMYGRCGSMCDAQQVFDVLVKRDTVTWSALISGYARQGESGLVFDLFQEMEQDGLKPDGITFLSVLSVCSRAGLVDKGEDYLAAMSRDHGITPTPDHYNCMVDLFGRFGQLDKAVAIAKDLQSSGLVWKTVLAACQKWGNLELGRQAFQAVVALDRNDTAAYILMWNIYQAACMPEDAKEVEAMRVRAGAVKTKPGQSWWTDMDGVVHAFGARHQEQPSGQGVYAKLHDILVKMEESVSC